MKYYKFDEENLRYVEAEARDNYAMMIGFILLYLVSIPLFMSTKNVESSETPVVVVDKEAVEFSEENLVKLLVDLNIRYPHIVLAQARHETGNYTSKIFKENNNLFGMKQAKSRPTSCLGTKLGHAYYDNWRQSVIDYALYQGAYLNDLYSESSYLETIGRVYAEDPNYLIRITELLEKTKPLFDE